MHWFCDPRIVQHLPVPFRFYAAYARAFADPKTAAVRGGSTLQRNLARLSHRLGGTDIAVVDIDGLKVAVDLSDLRMIEVFAELTTPSPELDILRASLGPGDTFLDIGANHATFAMQLASVVGPKGRVMAFEPQPRLVHVIRRSMSENGFAWCEVIEGACGDVERDLSFFVPALSGAGSLFRESTGTNALTTLTVRQRRLDDLMSTRPVRGRVAIKLDVEGAEVAVITGGREFLRAHRPPILIEMNADSMDAANQSIDHLVSALDDAGYASFSELSQWPAVMPLHSLRVNPQRNVIVTAAPR